MEQELARPSGSALRPWMGLGLIVFGLLYLTNPGLRWFEWVPDGAPLLGNLDEALVTVGVIVGWRWCASSANA